MKKLIIVLAILAVLCGIGYGGYEYVKADFPRFCEESVPIFAYHRVEPGHDDPYTMPPEAFEEQMKYLKDEGWKTITLAD